MDWISCPGCGTRYLATDPACPSCARTLPAANLRVLAAEQARRPPARDPVLFAVHLAFAASLLWVVASSRLPRWFLPLAVLELAVAIGALVRWRVEPGLVHARACVYGALASVLFWSRIGGPVLLILLFVNAVAVWWFGRGAIARGAGATVPAIGEGSGLFANLLSVPARAGDGGGTETLLPAALTWLILIASLPSLVR